MPRWGWMNQLLASQTRGAWETLWVSSPPPARSTHTLHPTCCSAWRGDFLPSQSPEARSEAGGRCPCTQGKQLEIRPLWTDTSRWEWQDNWARRLGPAQTENNRSHSSHSQCQETSLTTHAQKGFLEVKRGVMLMPSYPQSSSAESILAKRCICAHGRTLRYANRNQVNQND